MITLTREEAQQVLDALEYHVAQTRPITRTQEAIETLRARLAQPEPEPVAWMMLENKLVPIHTAPPQREWQGLTYKERNDCLVEADPCEALLDHEAHELMRTVEDKLKEKNG